MGEDDRETINHPAPTSCIQLPRFEASVASHSLRNRGTRSGDQAGTARPLMASGSAPA